MSEPISKHYQAVERLLREHADGLILYARQGVGAAAEDIVQDAFLKLLRTKTMPDAPKAWLYRVVRNALIDRKRREVFCKTMSVDNWFESISVSEDVPDFDGEALTRALESLESMTREIIVSKIWGEMTFKEIAELTGRPTSSVHYDYQQGIARLRESLEKMD